VLTSSHPFGALDAAAIIITAAAIVIESVADEQLKQFTKEKHNTGALMESGLWAYSRHPNYLGEVTFWWGLYIFALASGMRNWWMGLGPLAITALFVFISVPMMDRRNMERRPGYAKHRQNIPSLLPRFQRNKPFNPPL
jgi:steroid 5-alpha reductase family enzyme